MVLFLLRIIIGSLVSSIELATFILARSHSRSARRGRRVCDRLLADVIQSVVSTFFEVLSSAVEGTYELASSGVVVILEKAKEGVEELLEILPEVIEGAAEMVGRVLVSIWENYKDAIGYVRENI
uniref:Uncharacterized protein n=1 Tax=Ananas comosus var. bracteatus TaxID=296719 RepID=A0A6V7P0U9_ANACO|nr:unnamed protein product [Ananas comosus var. bracteatus]